MRYQESEWSAGDGTRLFARSWGPEADAAGTVGIVHGLGEHSGRYAHVAARLVEAGFAVLAFDQRGHGWTGGPRGHVRDYEVLLDDVDVLVAQARRLARGRPVFLYGHSMGGAVVLNHALRRRPSLAGLVVGSPLLRLARPPPALKRLVARVLNRVWPRFTFDNGISPGALSHDPAAVRACVEDPLVHRRISARLGTELMKAGLRALADAPALELPLLLMHGTADTLTSPGASAAFAGAVRGRCHLRMWEGLFHELHWEREREAVIGSVIDWLRETMGAESGLPSRTGPD